MSFYKIKELPIMERPRERIKEVGVSNVSDVELLSVLLKTGVAHKNVKELSMEVLKKFELIDLREVTIEDLKKISGIGEVKAIELLAAIEFGKRVFLRPHESFKKLDHPAIIYEDAKYYFFDKKQEMFYCYYFDNKQKLIKRKMIFMGTINASITHIREVFKEAYKVSATSIVCLHNHPSGDVTPSKADISFTKNLVETGNIQGIPVVDHIIVGDDRYYSFYEENQI